MMYTKLAKHDCCASLFCIKLGVSQSLNVSKKVKCKACFN